MAPASKFSAQEQEVMILDAAANCINESSITDFTMAKVAKNAGLSMGSVYKFVQSKEDILLALAHRSFAHILGVFRQVLALPMTTPERILAISLISPKTLQLYPFDYELQSYAINEAVMRRASSNWTNRLIESNSLCEAAFKQSLIEGIEAGELENVPDRESIIEEIIVGCWAMCVGYDQVIRVQQSRQIIEGTDSLLEPLQLDAAIIRCMRRLLNSYPWKAPISDASLSTIHQHLTELQFR